MKLLLICLCLPLASCVTITGSVVQHDKNGREYSVAASGTIPWGGGGKSIVPSK